MSLLDKIKGHFDLVQLNEEQRLELCKEIREFLVTNVSKTGGHLASNLGAVELTVAIETVFDTAADRLVFGAVWFIPQPTSGRGQKSHTKKNNGGEKANG